MAYNNLSCDKHSGFEPRVGYETEVVLPAAILSLLFGLLAFLSNSFLLLTLFQDPLKCFKARSAVVFVFFLALSDFLGALLVQLLHSLCMFCRFEGIELDTLYDIVIIGSHLGTKISVFTVVGMSLDRYLAVKLSWRYRTLVTYHRAVFFNVFLWILIGCFEASHSTDEALMHQIDVHLQTTIPLTLLTVTNLATYFEFRRYSRNTVLAQGTLAEPSAPARRNLEVEKKIIKVVLIIMVVLFVSLVPYLVTNHLYEDHAHEEDNHSETECNGSKGIESARNIAVALLCVSSVFNPFLYAFRLPSYRRAFRLVLKRLCGGTETSEPPEEVS